MEPQVAEPTNITQTLDELKAKYLARELAEAEVDAAGARKAAHDADLNFDDARRAASDQMPECLKPYARIERPETWNASTTYLRVNIEIPEHAPMFFSLIRLHTARVWTLTQIERNRSDGMWGVVTYCINASHKEIYAAGEWVGWLQGIETRERTFQSLGEALVTAEREYKNLPALQAQVDAANAPLKERAERYVAERNAPRAASSDAPELTTEEKFMSSLKDLILEFASQTRDTA